MFRALVVAVRVVSKWEVEGEAVAVLMAVIVSSWSLQPATRGCLGLRRREYCWWCHLASSRGVVVWEIGVVMCPI